MSGSSIYAYEDELDNWMKKITIMLQTLEKMLETQKQWLLLEPVFNNKLIQKQLSQEFKKYKDYEKIF